MNAVQLASEALRVAPYHLGLLETLAKSQWQVGQHRNLLGTLDRLITINPYEVGYHALKGAAYQCLSRFKEAMESYLRAKEMPEAAFALAELQEWQAYVMAEMVREDPVLRARYHRDAAAACSSVGFAFVTTEYTANQPRINPSSAVVTARPS